MQTFLPTQCCVPGHPTDQRRCTLLFAGGWHRSVIRETLATS